MKQVTSGGGWPAIAYTLRKAREAGGPRKLWRAMRSRNACKTCALGMGGQQGGMVNEQGRFPEVCKKSLQAMASDMRGAIRLEFWKTWTIDQLQGLSPQELEACGRLSQPVILHRGRRHYEPVSWDEALGRIARTLRAAAPDETFWYFSGRSSNEAGFLLQLFARVYGTNNVNNCSYYCHQASGVGLTSSIGSSTATVVLEDLEHSDCVFLIGGNPASNHPRLMTTLLQIRRAGGQVIVINPVRETGLINFRVPSDLRSLFLGSPIASTYVQPHIGGDLALLTGIAKAVVDLGLHDAAFLDRHCAGSAEWLAHLRAQDWPALEAASGVDRAVMEAVARDYGRARRAIFAWAMGITHHEHGVENVQAIANLAMVRGMLGKRHAGLMPIRGHSNVQGIGSVGVTPKLKDEIYARLTQTLGVTLPTTPGLDTLGCMHAAAERSLTFGLCLGGNLYGSNPDAAFARHALAQLDMVVYLSTSLNTGHAHGLAAETVILPVLARDEEPYATTQESMFNYVRLSDGGPERFSGARGEIHVIADIAALTLDDPAGPVRWPAMREAATIRQMIARAIPGFEHLATIDESRQEFQIEGRTFHTPTFPTPDGRAILHRHAIPALRSGEATLRLMTVRSEGQFNTVVYEDGDLYRGQERRDLILMHPDDLRRFGLTPDEPVVVRSDVGAVGPVLARAFAAIRPGNALMYYPEANELVPRRVDPASRTPAFKNVLVRLERLGTGTDTRTGIGATIADLRSGPPLAS